MLYQIEDSPLKIMGTMHVFPDGNASLPDWVEHGYRDAEVVWSEHDWQEARKYDLLPPDQSLKQLLPKKAWDNLLLLFPGREQEISRWRPAHASGNFVGAFMGPQTDGVERQIQPRETNKGRQLQWLESAAEVARLFDTAPARCWAETMLNIKAAHEEGAQFFSRMYERWKNCDRDGLATIRYPGGRREQPELRRVQLEVRNAEWTEKIAMMRPAAPTLIMVGALHLAGKNNLIALLAKRGVKLKRLA